MFIDQLLELLLNSQPKGKKMKETSMGLKPVISERVQSGNQYWFTWRTKPPLTSLDGVSSACIISKSCPT